MLVFLSVKTELTAEAELKPHLFTPNPLGFILQNGALGREVFKNYFMDRWMKEWVNRWVNR